jgi:peroxiredoxin
MKSLMLVAVLALMALKPGEKMPAGDVKLTGEKETTLSELKGKNGTLVIVTCNGCPYAVAWEKRIVELGNGCAAKGIGAVAINPNDPGISSGDSLEKTLARAKKAGFQFPYVVDGSQAVSKALGASKTPECYLFDKDGTLVYHGAVDDNSKDASKVEKHFLREAIEALAAGKAIPVAETKALGCGVKYRK